MQQNGKYGPEIDFAVKLDRRSGTVKRYVVKSYDDLDIENQLYGLKSQDHSFKAGTTKNTIELGI